jgi:UDP:flavonoid glycosyltransferase YjiC (YdhE family)
MDTGLAARLRRAYLRLEAREGRRIPLLELGERVGLALGVEPLQQPALSRYLRATRQLPPGCLAVLGAPHGVVFPRAAAILHHGGAGTTGEAMRAGRPMLITPFAGDQFDNAARMVRSGVAASRAAASADATSLEAMLRRVLAPEVIARASALGARVSVEDGVGAACDVIECGLRRTGRA